LFQRLQVLNKSGNRSKIFELAKLISIVGSTQAVLQGINIVTGILIIRLLPTREYAFYTIANTMLGTMVLLSDSGVGIGVMSEGGKVWQDKEKLGEVLNTGLLLRKTLGVISLCVVSPILLYLLLHNKASFLEAIIIILALIPAFLASLSDSILEIVPRLHQDLNRLQKNQVWVSVVRLFTSALGLFLLPLTVVSFLANAIPRLIGNFKLRKITDSYVEGSNTNKETRKNILKIVKRAMPSAIYYCFVGQISLWVISIFGKTASVAAIGALGRIAFVTNLAAIIFSMLYTPRFARMDGSKKNLLFGYLSSQGMLALALVSIILGTWVFSQQILIVLGKNYTGLEAELLLSVISSSIGVMTGASLNLYTSRGWVINPVINIILNLGAMVAGILIFDLTSLKGVLYMGIFIASIEFIVNYTFGALKIVNLPSQEGSRL
jgi:O-antigen/teichoic acid export membrane protein